MMVSKLSLVLVSLAFAGLAFGSDDWEAYKVRFGKSYDDDEEPMRKSIFLSTQRKIEDLNSSNRTWTVGLNVFSDWTVEEKKKMLNKAAPSSEEHPSLRDFEVSSDRQIPESVDYSKDPCVPPVKSQKACGCCYSFASITSIEYQACKASGKLVTYSEQQIVDCGIVPRGCDGGFCTSVWSHLQTYGTFTEEEHPYRANTLEACPYCKKKPRADSVRPKVWGKVKGDAAKGVTTSEAMVQALIKYGPLSISLGWTSSTGVDLGDYQEGVYDDPGCSTGSEHAVVLAGYGRDEKTGLDYWLVRNSHGKTWGLLGGHFMIRRGVNRCGIENYAHYVSIN